MKRETEEIKAEFAALVHERFKRQCADESVKKFAVCGIDLGHPGELLKVAAAIEIAKKPMSTEE